jgi:hypothetical protein
MVPPTFPCSLTLQQGRAFTLDVLGCAAGLFDELEQLFLRCLGWIVTERNFSFSYIVRAKNVRDELVQSIAQAFFPVRVKLFSQFDFRGNIFFRAGKIFQFVRHI